MKDISFLKQAGLGLEQCDAIYRYMSQFYRECDVLDIVCCTEWFDTMSDEEQQKFVTEAAAKINENIGEDVWYEVAKPIIAGLRLRKG